MGTRRFRPQSFLEKGLGTRQSMDWYDSDVDLFEEDWELTEGQNIDSPTLHEPSVDPAIPPANHDMNMDTGSKQPHGTELKQGHPESLSVTPQTTSQSSDGTPVSPPMSRIGLNANKAGMEGLDKAKINQVILEASKGSKFYENEVKKEKQATQRVNQMLKDLKKITPAEKLSALRATDKEIEALEVARDLTHIIVHIDMDAFYAAVEIRDNPKLKDVPMAVGSDHMLSTSNYVARRYGVRAAMPGFIAKKLCPELVIVKLNFSKYRQVGEEVRQILEEYDPDFCPMGLDESYLDLTEYVTSRLSASDEKDTSTVVEDMTGVATSGKSCDASGVMTPLPLIMDIKGREDCSNGSDMQDLPTGQHDTAPSTLAVHTCRDDLLTRLSPKKLKTSEDEDLAASDSLELPLAYWESAQAIVEEIRTRIFEKTGLTASAGIAPNKMLAKVASDMNKPNGQYFVMPTREGVLDFVQKLPIRKISGIGKVTEKMLNALEVTTCRDLYEQRAVLHLLFSQISSQSFLRICLGIGSADVHRDYQRKSISTERTFAELSNPADLQSKCYELCQSLAEDMEKEKIKGRTVTLKLKTVFFKVKSHATTVPKPVSSSEDLYRTASELLKAEMKACSPAPLRLRLMGVRVSSLQCEEEQHCQQRLEGFFQQPSSKKDQPSTIQPAAATTEPVDMPEDADRDSMVVCPVCGHHVPSDNTAFNQHIDECLNRAAVQETISAAASIPSAFGRSKVSPSKSGGEHSKTSRKRKSTSHKEIHARKKRTLDYFWQ